VVRREPVGVVAAITPFNDPLNLVTHKVGPALAVGNSVTVKPDPRTPLSALALGRVLVDSGVPDGYLSVLPAEAEVSEALVCDRRVRLVSFTGGRATGARVQAAAGLKRTLLELGGICPTIVMDDADLDQVVPAVIDGAFAAAGQNCLHGQRVLVHRSLYSDARQLLVAASERLVLGTKSDERTDVGPLIDQAAQRRVAHIVNQAVADGARLLAGGGPDGPRYRPTLVEDLPDGCQLAGHEVFGPVTELICFSEVEQPIDLSNKGDGGIHAVVFTIRTEIIDRLTQALDFGGVVIGGTSDRRSDALPFGGTGIAGIGREGVASAAEAMSEPKTVLTVTPTAQLTASSALPFVACPQ
jgi:glyceraldehyde-3-phosphate dehydrogenase (NADP+)